MQQVREEQKLNSAQDGVAFALVMYFKFNNVDLNE
jgi:hypothetical protein